MIRDPLICCIRQYISSQSRRLIFNSAILCRENTGYKPVKNPNNLTYLKAYVLAMVGNYNPLYRLYMEHESGQKPAGCWKNADAKAGIYSVLLYSQS